jgi:hypothetical protein
MSSDSRSEPKPTGPSIGKNDPIYGVFAYVDVTITEACQKYVPPGRDVSDEDRLRLSRAIISQAFRLEDSFCPICEQLSAFGLFFHEDLKDALAHGYLLYRNGKDPTAAFHRSYAPTWAILSLIEEYEWRNPRGPHAKVLEQLRWHSKPGDRVVRYSTMDQRGMMLIRGLHRVTEIVGVIMTPVFPNQEWLAEKEKFDALGGAKGLLEGRFSWQMTDLPLP